MRDPMWSAAPGLTGCSAVKTYLYGTESESGAGSMFGRMVTSLCRDEFLALRAEFETGSQTRRRAYGIVALKAELIMSSRASGAEEGASGGFTNSLTCDPSQFMPPPQFDGT